MNQTLNPELQQVKDQQMSRSIRYGTLGLVALGTRAAVNLIEKAPDISEHDIKSSLFEAHNYFEFGIAVVGAVFGVTSLVYFAKSLRTSRQANSLE